MSARAVVSVMLAVLAAGCQGRPPTSATPQADAPIPAAGLHNVLRVTDKLYSGSAPEGEEGFRSLCALGVRTVISVDGARPDVELARQHGLRYVHLPIGYDGVPRAQALRIARAVRDLPGPVYLHCHHGQHRGPAAAAAAWRCLDGTCPAGEALALLRRAGTDPHYAGLYATVEALAVPAPGELDRVAVEFPEVAEVNGLARLMVGLDERWDRVKAVRAAGWRTPPGHPDLDPPHEALQVREHYRELARLPDVPSRPDDFRRLLGEAEGAAGELEAALRVGSGGAAAEPAYQRSAALCTRCHARFRDVPRTP
jgi:protein tyrosine phosphatase (PTP) superfamily phosphohydrolase (DUF442 family)